MHLSFPCAFAFSFYLAFSLLMINLPINPSIRTTSFCFSYYRTAKVLHEDEFEPPSVKYRHGSGDKQEVFPFVCF